MSVKMAGCNPALITSGMTSGSGGRTGLWPYRRRRPAPVVGNDTPLQNQAVAFNNAGGSKTALQDLLPPER